MVVVKAVSGIHNVFGDCPIVQIEWWGVGDVLFLLTALRGLWAVGLQARLFQRELSGNCRRLPFYFKLLLLLISVETFCHSFFAMDLLVGKCFIKFSFWGYFWRDELSYLACNFLGKFLPFLVLGADHICIIIRPLRNLIIPRWHNNIAMRASIPNIWLQLTESLAALPLFNKTLSRTVDYIALLEKLFLLLSV